MADKRKSHYFRVLGQSRGAGGAWEDDPSIWLDLERLEYYQLKEGGGPDFVRTNVKLKWYEDDAGQVPNASRETAKLYIIPPDEDPNNPTVRFPVDVVEKIKVRDHDQIIYVHFNNEADNRGRKVKVRRIVHYDTTADDLPQYVDGGVIEKADYRKLRATKDPSQHVDIEIIEKRGFRDADQVTYTRYNIQPLIDASEAPDIAYGEGQINPPWRLDPLQTVININRSLTVIVAFAHPFTPGSASSLHQGATYLGLRTIDELLINVHLFKVNAGIGEEFARTIAPSYNPLVTMNWFVLPWVGDESANIERALDAVEQFFAANIFDSPLSVLSPEGVLWNGFFFQLIAGATLTWKIDYTNHRGPGGDLPNKMVQCFPLRSTPSTASIPGEPPVFFANEGFHIHYYRLDRKGEGPAYDPPPEWANDQVSQVGDSGAGNYGCKFQDELPLASVDRPYTNIFGTRGLSEPPDG